ncbi:MAG: hypothetical protein UW72_C0002G0025 [Parcubacteria group bacterium GW2011_GWF2_44_7]|nr:MAG: hypothetical protein UW72_C0002G0025 [Parcubacteria group bacterium GW2011_GWF2_44_7]
MLGARFYLNHSRIEPARGGTYTEGFIGSPRFLNPTLSQLKDADRDLCALIFSGLLKYNGQGELVSDLAQEYKIGDNGKIYDVILKDNLKWHDGKDLTIDDVIFTLQIIQNPEYKSPLRLNWQGVEFEKIDEKTIRFKIKNAYSPFPHNLNFGILPKHLWESISPAAFALTELNLKPIGSGPYKFSKLQKDKDGNIKNAELISFDKYYGNRANIDKIIFQFYSSEELALNALKNGEITGINSISSGQAKNIKTDFPSFNIYSLQLPRYFAIFFNESQNAILTDKNIRQALAYATNKKEMIENILSGYGQEINSSFLPGMTGYSDQIKKYDFNLDQAKNLLDAAGWKDADNDGFLEKNDQKLEITLTTADWPELAQTAQLIKSQWEKIGFRVNLEIKEIGKIQNDIIRPRQYQALLFGQTLSIEPDPFSFWHSSQKKDPGLNLSLYENRDADKLLEEARQSLDNNERAQKYQQLSSLLAEDLPTIFLFSLDYLFGVNNGIKGINYQGINITSARFGDVNHWYIKAQRKWQF